MSEQDTTGVSSHCWFDFNLAALSYNALSDVEITAKQKKRICEYNIAIENQEDVWRGAHLAGDK